MAARVLQPQRKSDDGRAEHCVQKSKRKMTPTLYFAMIWQTLSGDNKISWKNYL
jgi:hypothetical protein